MAQTVEDLPVPVPKQRLLWRLGRQLMIHVHIISGLCYTAGVVAVLLLPLLAKNTYISENALMPGSGNPVFGISDALDVRRLAMEARALVSQELDGHRAVSRWLVKRMGVLGTDCYLHPFSPPQSKWRLLNLSSVDHLEVQTGSAVNVVGIIRAPQGEGNEAIVLVTPFNIEQFGEEDALSLGIGLALFSRLSKALWIARDIIWLVADARFGAYPAVAEWLREYHEPTSNHLSMNTNIKSDLVPEIMLQDGDSSGDYADEETLSDFKRAGTIATGLVFEFKMMPGETSDTLKLRAEGPNGQMPNLDLINIINSIAVWRESLSVQLETLPSLIGCGWLSYIGKILKGVSHLGKQISPDWDFTLAAAAYPQTLGTLLSSMYFQVTGLPTGAHGAFRDYQIDAVSLQFPVVATVFDYSLTKFGRLLEGVVRCVNNLLEKWHQSFFLYFLSAPHKYISVGVYMQPFALLLISLPLTAAALCFPVNGEEMKKRVSNKGSSISADGDCRTNSGNEGLEKSNPEGMSLVDDSGQWLRALLLVVIVQIWAFFTAVMLALLSHTNLTAGLKLCSWLAAVAVSLTVSLHVHRFLSSSNIHRSPPQPGQIELWVAVKALTLAMASICLAVMSTINYPVALLGALLLVPMCLGVYPVQYIWKYAHRPGKSFLAFIPFGAGALLVILGSPPGLAGLVRILCGHLWRLTPSNFWYLLESLLTWRSALLPYLLVVHLPCSVLCVYILLSSDDI